MDTLLPQNSEMILLVSQCLVTWVSIATRPAGTRLTKAPTQLHIWLYVTGLIRREKLVPSSAMKQLQ